MHSGSVYTFQTSCSPNVQNAGNYYSWSILNAGGAREGNNAFNSICPKNWKITSISSKDNKTYTNLFSRLYRASTSASAVNLPLSYTLTGNAAVGHRGETGYYWTSTAEGYGYSLEIYKGSNIQPDYYGFERWLYNGMSARCVAR